MSSHANIFLTLYIHKNNSPFLKGFLLNLLTFINYCRASPTNYWLSLSNIFNRTFQHHFDNLINYIISFNNLQQTNQTICCSSYQSSQQKMTSFLRSFHSVENISCWLRHGRGRRESVDRKLTVFIIANTQKMARNVPSVVQVVSPEKEEVCMIVFLSGSSH